MSRKEILEILRTCKRELSTKYGISKIGVFGSVARNEANKNSDIDIVINIYEPDFFMLSGIKSLLEKKLLTSVDIVTYRPGMNEFLKRRIDSEAVYV